MNIENFERWLTELREGGRLQVTGKLARRVMYSDKIGYCCLGVGAELAGVPKELVEYADDPEDYYGFGDDSVTDLAPPEFVEWLGLPERDYAIDLSIDWPDEYAGYRMQGKDVFFDQTHLGTLRPIGTFMTCAGLNDDGFTFGQIADILAYFGLREQS